MNEVVNVTCAVIFLAYVTLVIMYGKLHLTELLVVRDCLTTTTLITLLGPYCMHTFRSVLFIHFLI